MKRTKQHFPSILSLIISMSIGFVLISSHKATADSVVDSVRIRVPAACTLSSSIAQGQAHSANIAGGVYKTEIGITNLKIVCNDNGGFSLYAVGYTDGVYGKTTLTSSLGPSHDIVTGTAESGNTSNWAMKVDTIPNATYSLSIENGFNDYSAVPSRFAKVATRNAGTDVGQQAVGSNLTTTYAAYISKTQPAGSYIGQVKYTLVHPYDINPPQEYKTESGYIGYYPNATSYVGSMEQQAIQQGDTSTILKAPSYVREGYGFAGWNTAFDYTGDYYGPNETISFEPGQYVNGEKGLSLYAVWVRSEGEIQDWSGCPTLSIGEVTALTDKRDNNTYAVAKLADGKCWMIENQRINDNAIGGDFITNTDNVGENFNGIPANSNEWNDSNVTLPQFNNSNLSIGGISSYGGYYSWPTTIANLSSFVANNENATTSICPSGWNLPTGGQTTIVTSADYYNLIKNILNAEPNQNLSTGYGYYNGTNYSNLIRKYPNNFVYSGYWNISQSESNGENGYYWTSASNNSRNAYYMYLSSEIIRPGNGYNTKNRGATIRCINSTNN